MATATKAKDEVEPRTTSDAPEPDKPGLPAAEQPAQEPPAPADAVGEDGKIKASPRSTPGHQVPSQQHLVGRGVVTSTGINEAGKLEEFMGYPPPVQTPVASSRARLSLNRETLADYFCELAGHVNAGDAGAASHCPSRHSHLSQADELLHRFKA